jgi:hypothetical protein
MERDAEEYGNKEHGIETEAVGNVSVIVSRPHGWGEGYAVGIAIKTLLVRYERLFGKKFPR